MIWLIVAWALFGGAMTLAHRRLALYRHDQRWQRERGARFGDLPLAMWWGEQFDPTVYSPEGRRLLPWVLAFDVVGIVVLLALAIAVA